jgi:hypothetical protein
MITWIVLAALSATSPGDVVATWVHEDSDARIAITLDADGGCMIESTRTFNGATYKEICGYTVTGSTVAIRTKGDGKSHSEFSLFLNPRTDEMRMGNADDGARFYRTRLERR